MDDHKASGWFRWLSRCLHRLLGSDAEWVLGDLEERRRKRRGPAVIQDVCSVVWWGLVRVLMGMEGKMDRWVRDVREAIRGVRRRKAYAAGVAATLALGIATLAAAFTVVDGILLRPLPFPNSDQLVRLYRTEGRGPLDLEFTPRQMEALQSSPIGASGLGAFSRAGRTLQISGAEAYNVTFARVTPGLLSSLGVAQRIGRLPDDEELRSGARVVLLSEGLWRSRFAADPSVLGSQVRLDEIPHTVIGVLAAEQRFPEDADLWRPLTATERADGDPELIVVARRPPDVSAERFADMLVAAVDAAQANDPDAWRDQGARAVPLQDAIVGHVKAPLWALLGAGCLVLLVAICNVTALQLVRGIEGRQDATVRMAFGASRAAVVRKLLAEALLLATLGGVLGFGLATAFLPSLRYFAVGAVPLIANVALDLRVVATVGLVTIVLTLLGALAAAATTVRQAGAGLRGGGGVVTGAFRLRGLRALVAAQLALTTVLIVTAALLTLSFQRLLTVPRGFDAKDVLAVSLSLSPSAVESAGGLRAFHDALTDRLSALPGIASVALSSHEPGLSRGMNPAVIGLDHPTASVQLVSPSFFRTIGLPVVEGSALPDTRDSGAAETVVVNRTFAQTFLGPPPWIGQTLTRTPPGQAASLSMEVVGVTEDVVVSPGEAPPPTLYASTLSVPIFKSLLIRVDGSVPDEALLPQVNAELSRLDPTQPMNVAARLVDNLAQGGARTGFQATLMSLFGVLGLVLASVGVYGVAAYSASQRRAEWGLRQALGASRMRVVRLSVGRALGFSFLGILFGLVGAWMASLALQGLLFEVTTFEPVVYVGVALSLGAVAFIAAILPAVRVTRAAASTSEILSGR